jgi:hypothetical protein
MIKTITVSWFSAGVSSAVATWLMHDKVDKIIYTHIDDQHPDTMRFVKDCERWFRKPVEILQSPYKNVDNAIRLGCGFINSPSGAICTRYLKRRVRREWEIQNEWFNTFRYVWGMDIDEIKPRPPRNQSRCDGLREAMPNQEHIFPLVEHKITKEEAHGILRKAGIKRPAMYDLGYQNNNCIGCVKGGMGYWNKIRVDFPEVFKLRAATERIVGASCLKKKRARPDEPAGPDNNVKLYLDELDPNAGRKEGPVVEECGAMCEIINEEQPH